MKPFLGIAVLLLAACAGGDSAPPPSTTSRAPVRPVAPVTRFDGTYAGSLTPTTGAYTCTNPVRGTRGMTITQGRVVLDMAPGRNSPMQGVVQEDGGLRATDPIDRTNAVTGQVINEQFVGAWQNGRCAYNLNFRRTG